MTLTILSPTMQPSRQELPYPLVTTRAGLSGFPSPAQDYDGRKLDLNEHLVKKPAATFFVNVTGDSMEGLGIHDSDLLVVDRSIDPRPGQILVAMVEGEVTVKRYERIGRRPYFISGNPRYAPLPVADLECQVWGVVSAVIHQLLK